MDRPGPTSVARAITSLDRNIVRLHETVVLADYVWPSPAVAATGT